MQVQMSFFAALSRMSGAENIETSLEKAISVAHGHNVKVHVAINAFFYLERQYEAAEKIIKEIFNIGADGVILADPVLLLKLSKDLLKGKDVVVGCDATIFNSAGVRFYEKLGATRIVFPRSMTVDEMKDVVELNARIEYEVFIIHDLCFFEDGFCTYCKEASGGLKKEGRGRRNVYFLSASRIPTRGFDGGCRTRFSRQKFSLHNNKQMGEIKPFTFWGKKHIQGCGVCALQAFKDMGITTLKVLDRNLPTEEKVKATAFIKKCQELLDDSQISKYDYIQKCKAIFKETFKVKCNRTDCYNPSVFLNGKSSSYHQD